MSKKIKIVEVGLRDGLQNEKQIMPLKTKLQLAKKLVNCGFSNIELGAFVSPKWVPQMAETGELLKRHLKKSFQHPHYSVLVPNLKGMQSAIRYKIDEVALFTAASETFCKKNINCSIEESFERFLPVIELAKTHGIKCRAYLSTSFACPYEGEVSATKVVRLSERLIKMGAYEVSIGDTIGIANPKQTERLLKLLLKKLPKNKIAMHFHDTRGMALANILRSLDYGIRTFDTSIGGLGGCPYAKGASGNVASEDVVNMLHSMGYSSGIDLKNLIQTVKWLSSHIDKTLPSKLSKIPLD